MRHEDRAYCLGTSGLEWVRALDENRRWGDDRVHMGAAYRVDPSRTGEAGGAGLGLAICRPFVQGAGGSIEASSEVGRGSEFALRMPASSAA